MISIQAASAESIISISKLDSNKERLEKYGSVILIGLN